MYTEDDIDFKTVSNDVAFENLCFDLIRNLNFHNVKWQKGSFDGGRDLEAYTKIDYPFVGGKNEKWFFECKYYAKSNGVPLREILDKISWAVVREVDKLVIVTSSHLTTQTKEYIEKIEFRVTTKIYYVECAELKRLILNFPDLVEKYFTNIYQKSAKSALNDFFLFEDEASISRISELSKHLKKVRYSFNEVVYLLVSYFSLPEEGGFGFPIEEIKDLIDEVVSQGQYFEKTSLEGITSHICKLSNINKQEMNYLINDSEYCLKIRAKFKNEKDPTKNSRYFFIEKVNGSVALEILVSPTNVEDWSIRIYNKENIPIVYKQVKEALNLP